MIKAYLLGDRVASSSPKAFSAYEKSLLGEKIGGRIEYSSVETLFLLKNNKMELFSKTKEINWEELIRRIRKTDKKIETKLSVFSDLRKKGYLVKSALKFGAEFRVYDKGDKPSENHARWILHCVKESESINWHDFAAKSRVAHSTKKNLLLGVVDEEGDVSYYEVRWERP